MSFAKTIGHSACFCALLIALAITGAAILAMVGVIGVRLGLVLCVSVLIALVLMLRFGAVPGKAE